MGMTFGGAHDVWKRAISGDETLREDEVRVAAQWLDKFSGKLGDKASQSWQDYQKSVDSQAEEETKEGKLKAAESDKRQVEDCVRKCDDLTNWLNTHQNKD